MAKTYTLKLKPGFPAEGRQRAGVSLEKGVSVEVELTADQLKAIEADEWISVTEGEEASKPSQSNDPQALPTTRKGLEELAVKLGIENPNDKNLYPNAEVLKAKIEDVQENGLPETKEEDELPSIDPSTLTEEQYVMMGVTEEAFNAMSQEEQVQTLKNAGIELNEEDK